MADPRFRVSIEERVDALAVTVSGEVDHRVLEDLRAAVRGLAASAHGVLVLDLAGVVFIDSAGLRVVFDLARRCRERGVRLEVVVPADTHAARVLAIADRDCVLRMVTVAPRAADPSGA